ncbi:Fe-S cluster assembly protein SufD [Desertivirga xinjiangensis]|uniref:Fe-S cluster assembly protein SufD n=1 Tax=Desertivirga xinjiangensis TaxID=539206 RepID=UPI00210EA0E7|nr:Fe-S cluster assembly protein SufD [Pedobacter xinjiangensis]
MIDLSYIQKRFDQLQASHPNDELASLRTEAFNRFTRLGIPGLRHEEWKYTNVSNLFNNEYQQALSASALSGIDQSFLDSIRLPGSTDADELFFVNGRFISSLSSIRSSNDELIVISLPEALKSDFAAIVKQHLGHSNRYLEDGIHALNTSFINDGVFIYVHPHLKQPGDLNRPLYFYHISDVRDNHILSQPRNLIFAAGGSRIQITETFATIGTMDNLSNQVLEVVVNKDAYVEYYKIQNTVNANQISTTHFHQTGKSYVHALSLTLNGGTIRNNTNLILDGEGCDSHLYGLYLINGRTHVDNHTLVDNRQPNCYSKELYKGIMDEYATGVFNGKIKVERLAQKTNAYQSNKNILLSDHASINTKPQLEIFADDVKCSHGCTVGTLDENAMFYLQARGIPQQNAKALLLKAFAMDILVQIKPDRLRNYVEQLISDRLLINE